MDTDLQHWALSWMAMAGRFEARPEVDVRALASPSPEPQVEQDEAGSVALAAGDEAGIRQKGERQAAEASYELGTGGEPIMDGAQGPQDGAGKTGAMIAKVD